MFDEIEKLIRWCGELHIEEERYGNDILVCIDTPININNATNECDATIWYDGHEVSDAVDRATSPGDFYAMNALQKLETFAEKHPEFLYARGKTLEEALINLNKRAGLWNELRICDADDSTVSNSQKRILMDFVVHDL